MIKFITEYYFTKDTNMTAIYNQLWQNCSFPEWVEFSHQYEKTVFIQNK